MGLSHDAFWSQSVADWLAALDGLRERFGAPHRQQPMPRATLTALMERYPDQ